MKYNFEGLETGKEVTIKNLDGVEYKTFANRVRVSANAYLKKVGDFSLRSQQAEEGRAILLKVAA